MANIKKTPSHKANLSLTGFDMSQRVLMTSSVGQLIPCYYDYLSPGEKVKGNCSIFTRTQPLQSTAFARMTEHVDFFFVPFDQLYSGFNSKYFNIQDINSSILNEALKNTNFPHITYNQIAAYLNKQHDKESAATFEAYDKYRVFKGANAIRLLESLGYFANFQKYPANSFVGNDIHYSAFPLLAYHKIYNDYYRLSSFEAPNPKQYNYDSHATSPSNDYINGGNALEIHYRAWKKDYFTNIFPTPFFDDSSPSRFKDINNEYISADGRNTQISVSTGVSLSKDFISQYGLAPQNLRSLLAAEKLKRITQFAGKHYDKQVLAHFGFAVPQGVSDEVYYLGSNSAQLNIQEVVATAGTDNNELGQLAGRGIAANKNDGFIDFTAPCHGIFMAIYSAVPEAEYEYGNNRLLSYVTPEHFYKPEYDNLGMQPIFDTDIKLDHSNGEHTPLILGWQYMYSELKTKFDIVTGAFVDSLRNWAPNKTQSILNVPGPSSKLLSNVLTIDPRYYNDIFLLEFAPIADYHYPQENESWHYFTFKRDPLLHSLMFNITKVSQMSTYSLPKL